MPKDVILVIISANAEWRTVKELIPEAEMLPSPYGEWFRAEIQKDKTIRPLISQIDKTNAEVELIFFHGGWGKISAAGSVQFAIDFWRPKMIINLGTCGGFSGYVERGEIILVERTIVYDIIEQMGDFDAHIAHYTTTIDLDWLKGINPHTVRRTLMVSADKDLLADEIEQLHARFGAVVGDWESGAIAWVAKRNQVRLLILRGVTDLVSMDGGEAYANHDFFVKETVKVMDHLINALPAWIEHASF
jgi:adenosylhomocysteine nucleosidase